MIPISDYDYQLPSDLIAQLPADKREESRLMILNKSDQKITHSHFFNIIDELNMKCSLKKNLNKQGKRLQTN